MKIAFIGQKGIPTKQGGIEKHVEELSMGLAQAGFDVTVYSRFHYTKSTAKKYRGVNIINLPSFNTKHLDAITHTLFASIHALFQNYDIIHYHGVGPSLLSWIPRVFKPGTKVIATFHCLDRKHQKWGLIAKTFLALGEWTVCHFPHQTIVVSKILKKYCHNKFNREAFYIPNGISISNTSYNKKEMEKVMWFYDLKPQSYFLTVSRLIKHKGIHTLIEAYQKIKTDKKLVIVGDGAKTDKYVNHLKKLAGQNKNIIFTGQKSGKELAILFSQACIFIQPSESEGLSIALLEAINYGLPTIVSDIKENLEITGPYGLSFKTSQAESLAKKMDSFNKEKRGLIASAKLAKKHIQSYYDWKKIVNQTAEFYLENNESKVAVKKPELNNSRA